MNARKLFSSVLLLAGLAVLVFHSRSSSQEPTILIESQPIPLGDGERVPSGQRVLQNPIIGTLVEGPVEGIRAVTPAYQFDSARPMVIEYMQLHGQLAERLSDEELELEIAGLRATLQVLDADDNLGEIRSSLRRLIESHPDTPAAEAARRALEQLDDEDPAGAEFDPISTSGELKPAGGNRPFGNPPLGGNSPFFDPGSPRDDN